MAGKLNILLVDDSKEIINGLREILSEIKKINRIESCETLEEGYKIIDHGKIDLIVLDMNLPDGNGMDLLRWVKKNHPNILVIMFTSFSEPFFRNIIKKMGADYFFDKATEYEEIAKVISQYEPGQKNH